MMGVDGTVNCAQVRQKRSTHGSGRSWATRELSSTSVWVGYPQDGKEQHDHHQQHRGGPRAGWVGDCCHRFTPWGQRGQQPS